MFRIFSPFSIVLFASFVLFSSCKKDDDHDHDHTPIATKNSLSVEFDNVVGGTQLSLDTSGTTFTNGAGEKFSVTTLNYYISNIRFWKIDGTEYVVPQDSSYFMVQENIPATQTITIPNVPSGDYNGVTFTVGVDSLRSASDLSRRTGVLDPAYLSGHGMYWTWNSGYIFLKLEGKSPASADRNFFYHIGGFGGFSSRTINNIKTVSLSFPTTAMVRSDKAPKAHVLVDVLKLFSGPATTLKIADFPMVMFSTKSVELANNYANMFTVHHVHND